MELADEAAAPTDDPNEASGQMQKVAPMHFVVASPTKGVYFVRHMAQRGSRNPDFLIMPVQPALTALRSLQPEDGANVINSSR